MPLAPIEIARLEEARQALGVADAAGCAEPVAGGWMCYGGEGSWANQACGLGMDGPVSDDDLDRLVHFYRSRAVEPRVELCPFADKSLISGLAERGFVVREFETVMARTVSAADDLRALLPRGWPDGLEIERLDPADDDAVRAYLEFGIRGFIGPEAPIPDSWIDGGLRVARHQRCDSFIGRIGGQTVGCGGMESAGRIACLFGATTHTDFRRRGVQQAMIVARIQRARQRGCDVVAIHSRPGIPTERNAMRLGFAVAYTKAIVVMPGEGLARSV
ncbi:MAG: hypothetical protein ACF8R7_06285 [Phycisphaerales bacterium JB039]